MRKLVLLAFFVSFSILLNAQMVVGTDTLYGNEWIEYSQDYYKIPVAEDGVYRLSGAKLTSLGINISGTASNQYRVFHLGKEVPIYVSSAGNLGESDYITFVGLKNRTEIENHLYEDPSQILNPEVSLFTDTSAYFLTIQAGNGLRYENMTNDVANPPEAAPYFLRKLTLSFQDYWTKKEGSQGSKFSHFDIAEGFTTTLKTTQSHSFTPVNPYLSGPNAKLAVHYAARGKDHHQEIRINGDLVATDEYNGWEARHLSFDFSASSLSAPVSFKMKGLLNNVNEIDRSRVSLLTLTYPQLFDFEGKNNFVFNLASNSKQFLEITNFNINNGIPVLYDAKNQQRFEGVINNGKVLFTLPQTNTPRELVLTDGDLGRPLGKINIINFTDYASANSDYLIISNERFYDDGNGNNRVQEYANYRASLAGGSYNPLIVSIQEVYDQFGYGIQRTPIGIRNMVQWSVRNWEASRFVYIIGKGRVYSDIRTEAKLAAAEPTMFVPTFGNPAGDNLLAISNFDRRPVVALGRLAVTSPDEIRIYLDKVKGQEISLSQAGIQNIAEQAWKKRFLHLGGGATVGEKTVIKSRLKQMEEEINTNQFAGLVNSFYKNINDPIQQEVPEEIFSIINDGAVFVSIFGHASPSAFDFNIDNPEAYFNKDKYPIIMSLGCYSGNMFTSAKGISERLCLYEEKGMIGFLGTSNLGLISTLADFATELYKEMGKQINGTMGEILQESFTAYSTSNPSSQFSRLIQQFMFHGDPAIHVGVMDGTDYLVNYQSVDFGQASVSSQTDSISLDFSIMNIGINYTDSVSLKLTHVLPNGQTYLEKNTKFFPQGYETPIHLAWANPGTNALGQNQLLMEIDFLQEVEELPLPGAELNNTLTGSNGQLGLPFFISDNTTTPIVPREFAIKNMDDIILIASTSNAFAAENKYRIQLDTTELFNSPLLETTEITQTGGLIKWKPNIAWQDTTVYYWRISPDSTSTDLGYFWSYSSFITTTDTMEGWSQSHFFQFKKDQFDDLVIGRDKDLEFSEKGFYITVNNNVYNADVPPGYIYNYESPAASIRPWNYINSGLAVVVGDQVSGGAWSNSGGLFGSTSTGFSRVFPYVTDTETGREKLINFLKDTIPDGSFVWLFTVLKNIDQDFQPENWAADSISLGINIFSLLEGEGATLVRNLESLGSVPYTISYQKGYGVLDEDIAATIDETIITESFIPIHGSNGQIQSKLIGPAMKWKDLTWESMNFESTDLDTLSVWGVNSMKTDTTLIFANVETLSLSLESIDVQKYPYLLLKYYLTDTEKRTAADLNFWQVHFDPLPELAVNSQEYYTFYTDTIDYGDVLHLGVGIENISSVDMDSVLVSLSIFDSANSQYNKTTRFASLNKSSSIQIDFEIPTSDLSKGINSIVLEANPNNDQIEMFHRNNFGLKNFYIKEDTKKPVLDVFFDGHRILNGDLVSSRPEIKMILDDENQFFMLTDTALVDMSIVSPNLIEKRIYFANPDVEFDPADTQRNKATITYHPIFSEDGIYSLIIKAKDVSGNLSGRTNYKVDFQVINKRMVSNLVPYPNPFSTSTRFAYTLTGDIAPEVFKIQILNLNGTVVREITQDEVGQLSIGTHLTDYQWDGRDEYGDLLAAGTYLYRVIVKDSDQVKYEHYSTKSDVFFEKSFGKIIILR